MRLKQYIDALTELLEEIGDPDATLYTSIDDEGNGYTESFCAPEIRYLSEVEDSHRPDFLIAPPAEDEIYRHWLDDNDLTEAEAKRLKKVVLL